MTLSLIHSLSICEVIAQPCDILSIRTHYTPTIIPYTSIIALVLSQERDVVILLPALRWQRSISYRSCNTMTVEMFDTHH
jgi:hypothetical protein